MTRRRQLTFEEVRPDFQTHLEHIQQHRHPIGLLLDRVTDVRNVGALFRLADAARINKIYGYRMETVPFNTAFRRVARSAEQFVPYEPLSDLAAVLQLKTTYQLLALEWTNDSVPYHQYKPQYPCLLAIGNEETGLSGDILQLVDACIHIPMFGVKTSLNVAMATGIAVYGLLERVAESEF